MSRASQAALPLPFSAQPHLALVIQAGWASAQNQQVETIIPGATGERIGHAVSPAAHTSAHTQFVCDCCSLDLRIPGLISGRTKISC